MTKERENELTKNGELIDLCQFISDETGVELTSIRQTIHDFILTLNGNQCELLTLHYISGNSIIQISHMTGKSHNDIEKSIRRGIKNLVRLYTELSPQKQKEKEDNMKKKENELPDETLEGLTKLSEMVDDKGIDNLSIIDCVESYPQFNIYKLNIELQSFDSHKKNNLTAVLRKFQETTFTIPGDDLYNGIYIFQGREVTRELKDFVLEYMKFNGYPLYLNLFKALCKQMLDGELKLGA